MPTLLIAVDVVGLSAAAGPVTAAAVFYPPEFEEPVFNYRNAKGVIVPGRFITEGGTPDYLRSAVLSVLRQQAVGWSVVSKQALTFTQTGVKKAALEAMGMAVARLIERLKLTEHPCLQGVSRDSLVVHLRGEQRLPESFVPHFVNQVLASEDWRLGAAEFFAQQRRTEEMHELSIKYPVYEFDLNQGRLTEQHRKAIRRHGFTPDHRR